MSSACPTCGTELPTDPRFVTWCHACGWNLSLPQSTTTPTRALDRLSDGLGRRLGDRLAEELARAGELAPRLTVAKLAAYGVAVAVHAFLLALMTLGAWLSLGGSGLFVRIGGVLLLGLGFLMRPRLGRRPSEGLLTRTEAPSLYSLADEVAAELETPRPHTIAVSPEYNASWTIVGLRRERVLSLGLPLLAVLDPQERVALIAHELAHARNGDATRGLFVGSAVESLGQLYVTLSPGSSHYEGSDIGIAELISRPVMWLLAQPIRLLLMVELLLLMRDSQRAEYLADGMAARIAGTDAVVSLHEKLLLEGTAEMAVHRAALSHTPAADVFDALRAAFDGVPERERERRRRLARLETARLGVTHPPSGKRIELLERRDSLPPAVVLDDARSEAIDADLDSVRQGVSGRLIEEYRALVEW